MTYSRNNVKIDENFNQFNPIDINRYQGDTSSQDKENLQMV